MMENSERFIKTEKRKARELRQSQWWKRKRAKGVCYYCQRNFPTGELTMDHVVPRHRGGEHVWENLVSACPTCNRRKGGKTVEQARMRLLRQPFEPRPTGRYLFQSYLQQNGEWEKFLEGWWE